MDATWLNSALDGLMSGDAGGHMIFSEGVLLALLVSFCIGHVVAWVYVWTHEGLSYSRMFAGSLLAMPVIVCLVMLLMAGSLVIAFGLLAVFTVVRFRNVLKDTRDTTFVLWAIVEGMACGTMKHGLALLGCAVVALVFIYMKLTLFGGRHRYDAILNVQFTGGGSGTPGDDGHDGASDDSRFRPVLKRHASRVLLANRRELDEL